MTSSEPEYAPSTYGERWASIYDDRHGHLDPTPEVEFLAGLAGAGPVLEFGIGTGRIALPLAARGIGVHGIDASESMVAVLRAKDRGREIPVTIGDFADVPVDGQYSLVFVAFNTFFALPTQEDQVRCFRGVAEHLAPGGVFAMSAFVPDPARFDRQQRMEVLNIEVARVELEATRHDRAAQRVSSQRIVITDDGVKLYPVQLRYAWPSELDLMARLGGLRLRERWGGWRREPFTSASASHVSVYELAS